MRNASRGLDSVKKQILEIKDKDVIFRLNKGRNKFITLKGRVNNTYPSIFTILTKTDDGMDIISCSYSDVLTGNIKFINFV
ncbi:MAG: Veg family protein [Christensenellales bacterium]|jgi:uncharacterized protein Veg